MTLAPTAPPPPPGTGSPPPRVRVAIYGDALEPPSVRDIARHDPAEVIEGVVDVVLHVAQVPPLALREIVENLVHAKFSDALVSVLDSGALVRVADSGPGIADPPRALEPGFTTAGSEERRIIRGAGAGLPLAAGLLAAAGGGLTLEEGLAGGSVATLAVPERAIEAAPPAGTPSDEQRALLALLLELADADAALLAAETGIPLAVCGRELAVLEHRGLLARNRAAGRSLTGAGRELVSSLF